MAAVGKQRTMRAVQAADARGRAGWPPEREAQASPELPDVPRPEPVQVRVAPELELELEPERAWVALQRCPMPARLMRDHPRARPGPTCLHEA